jgi:5-methylcytosine-specific restriction endonuclease McrA
MGTLTVKQEETVPIKPENRSRYPEDWKTIRAAILERAGNRCEGSPAFPNCRAQNGSSHPDTGSRVVLTIAHLDHVPENCSHENLRAWCQRCHLKYDAEHHAATARTTRKARRAAGDLFTT